MNELLILNGDCRTILPTLPEQSVQCCVTSPPYWGLRDYGVSGQIGLEPTPELYVETMRQVFRGVWRVLRDDGTLWLNLGDSYSGGGNYRGINSESTLTAKQSSNRGARGVSQQLGAAGKDTGLNGKNLIGIPWRVAFALQSDGWYLRSDIIWHKPNPMPESVTDRPTKSHEYLFLMSKNQRYYYDAEAIKEPATDKPSGNRAKSWGTNETMERKNGEGSVETTRGFRWEGSEQRNKRSVWTVPTSPYSEAHFATFPPNLIKPCILAGCPAGGTVLDPFSGSGTTGMVAIELGRKAVLIDLNQEYCKMANSRTNVTSGLPF